MKSILTLLSVAAVVAVVWWGTVVTSVASTFDVVVDGDSVFHERYDNNGRLHGEWKHYQSDRLFQVGEYSHGLLIWRTTYRRNGTAMNEYYD